MSKFHMSLLWPPPSWFTSTISWSLRRWFHLLLSQWWNWTTFWTTSSTTYNCRLYGKCDSFYWSQITWEQTETTTIAHLSQTAYVESILQNLNIDVDSINHIKTPYRSGLPVDSIKPQTLTSDQLSQLETKYRSILGSLNWLVQGTRPDIAVIHSLLAKYQNNPSRGHLTAAIHVLKYLRNTKHLGISFHTNKQTNSCYVN